MVAAIDLAPAKLPPLCTVKFCVLCCKADSPRNTEGKGEVLLLLLPDICMDCVNKLADGFTPDTPSAARASDSN